MKTAGGGGDDAEGGAKRRGEDWDGSDSDDHDNKRARTGNVGAEQEVQEIEFDEPTLCLPETILADFIQFIVQVRFGNIANRQARMCARRLREDHFENLATKLRAAGYCTA